MRGWIKVIEGEIRGGKNEERNGRPNINNTKKKEMLNEKNSERGYLISSHPITHPHTHPHTYTDKPN